MSDLVVRAYREADRAEWDQLVLRSRNGTMQHQRAFLDVAARRVEDRSLVLLQGSRLVAVMPAAVHPSEPTMIDSHPSTGHGGLVHDGRTTGAAVVEAIAAVAEHCYHEGFDTLRYKAVPLPYQAMAAQDDLYALHRLGGTRVRCELASLIDVSEALLLARHRQRHLRRAHRAGIEVVTGADRLTSFWPVLTARLADRHRTSPQHTLADLESLFRAFPDQVSCAVARHEGAVVAGAVAFRMGRVAHAQYLAADDRGLRLSALDLVIEHLVHSSRRTGIQFLSLGTTTLHGGRTLNEGLHRYKQESGAGDIVHETYDLSLR